MEDVGTDTNADFNTRIPLLKEKVKEKANAGKENPKVEEKDEVDSEKEKVEAEVYGEKEKEKENHSTKEKHTQKDLDQVKVKA